MNKKLMRAVVAVAAAGTVGAGLASAPGNAGAATPGDLKVTAVVICRGGETIQAVAVENVGGATITGVRAGRVAGPEVTPRAMKKNEPYKPNPKGNLSVASTTGIEKAGELKGGDSFVFAETFAGCGAPYAIVGYAIGNEVDNVFSAPNYDFDWGMAPPTLPTPTP